MKQIDKRVIARAGDSCHGKKGTIIQESKLKNYDWVVQFDFPFNRTELKERRDYKENELEFLKL